MEIFASTETIGISYGTINHVYNPLLYNNIFLVNDGGMFFGIQRNVICVLSLYLIDYLIYNILKSLLTKLLKGLQG